MKFTLTVTMDSAAFADDGNDGKNELARILKDIASDMEYLGDGGWARRVADFNGNCVGEWKIR
jgi:hypothetical protein